MDNFILAQHLLSVKFTNRASLNKIKSLELLVD